MDIQSFQEYLHFLDALRVELDQLAVVERRKLESVHAGDLAELDECMKKEQAASLSLRGYEQRRAEMLKKLGLERVSLRELPKYAPDELRNEAELLVERVQRSYQVLSSAQSSARALMEKDLHRIEKYLDGQQEQGEKPAVNPKQKTDFRA